MKILLCAINAKFIHSSLAIRSLYANNIKFAENIDILELSINNSVNFIVKEIYDSSPDVLCFSCYIWNIEIVKEIAEIIRKTSPQTKIIMGGPEVSFAPYDLLGKFCDIIVLGEGEVVFGELCRHFTCGEIGLGAIKDIAYIHNGEIVVNERAPEPPDLNLLAFPYTELESLANKIIYYESSRGCPFSCAYCISSTTEGVRFLDMDTVKSHINYFRANNIKLVKFVDRTFNCDAARALEIWRYIIDNDNGITSFHFEVGADLLTDAHIECLKGARVGLIQFEAGVQSTNPRTLKEICRAENFERLSENIAKIKVLGNIHIHLDLIAGLPFEDYESFRQSFNDCFALRPDMLQLGFLKLLKGSALRINSGNYGIEYKDKAPYEVLFTEHLSFSELAMLKDIEHLLDTYYNSTLTLNTLEHVIASFDTPFDFFHAFAQFWNKEGLHRVSHSRQALYDILYRYLLTIDGVNMDYAKDMLKLDMFMGENVKNLPDWLDATDYKPIVDEINAFFSCEENAARYFPIYLGRSPKQLSRVCHIERFQYLGGYRLFVYGGGKPRVFSITLGGGAK